MRCLLLLSEVLVHLLHFWRCRFPPLGGVAGLILKITRPVRNTLELVVYVVSEYNKRAVEMISKCWEVGSGNIAHFLGLGT